ncbi:MAG: hypothetical protein K2H23_08810, partial [Oscillospiraceae bacterium]|nr:hypothetical protein [Oscillospiraceae bacterium]
TTYNFGYINSYLEAANDLLNFKCPDLYVYPIMFCYRQYIELSLKNICQKDMAKQDYIKFIRKASHNLNAIWKEAKKHLNAFNITDEDQINFMSNTVNDFNLIDPTSFSFRYPQDKNMNKSLENHFSRNDNGTVNQLIINLNSVSENLENFDLIIRHTYDSV